MTQNASSLAPSRPPQSAPATLEGVASFRVQTAALSRPAGPARADPNMVLITDPDGGVIVYPPSEKLAILAAERAKRLKQPANS
jgi:hypothetical protein